MKAITIIQPWATLIALGEKRIETRSWKTSYRGELLIHAGKKIEKRLCDREPFWSTLHSHGIDSFEKIPNGAIIAKCNLVDCVKIKLEDSFLSMPRATLENEKLVCANEYYFGDYTPGRYAWILENVEMLDEPIQAKGQLNLWNYKV